MFRPVAEAPRRVAEGTRLVGGAHKRLHSSRIIVHDLLITNVVACTRPWRRRGRRRPILAAPPAVRPPLGRSPPLPDTRAHAEFRTCGSNPIPASSGKTNRHRLNRAGDRHANAALWRIVIVRLSYDQRTRDYLAKRDHEGKSKTEAIRCLKRYVAREIYNAMPASTTADRH
jgi:hypothetical protein